MVVASGAAALVFETLWFRLCALMLGNGVWASSLVLSGFMAGLAAGNWCASRASRWRRPLLVYAALETTVAVLGLLVVFLLPALTRLIVPWLGPALEAPLARNGFRLVSAFLIMAGPAAAMGATLPTLVHALGSEREAFGSLLGRLYAWNTAGAVLGALAAELLLIERLGIRGAALVSSGLDLLAALLGLALARRFAPRDEPAGQSPTVPLALRSLRIGLAAATCGAALLALEVIWFRYLALRVLSTTTGFAVMLAVVLSGIALGGGLAGAWCGRRPRAPAYASAVACLAGVALVASFSGLGEPTGRYLSRLPEILLLSLRLILPTSLVSGALFVLLGSVLQEEVRDEARAAGLLTLANTAGAMAGALLAGFVLLPRLGVEGSLIAAACAYAAAGALVAPHARARPGFWPAAAGVAALALALLLFPRGLVERTIRANAAIFAGPDSRILAVREGRLETLVYLRQERWGQTYYDWLLTNGFSMAGTNPGSQRYMKMFAYWPMALRPDAKSALLICFGVGNTAQAFVSVPSLASLDVVDISPDVLELSSSLLYPPGRSPLDDARTRVHVEDGRFFLQMTRRRFDVITAEPPPPKNPGVASLYSREYFELVRDRLNEGGIATHWLPVYQLSVGDARAIVTGFCSAFPDCSLWSGRGLEFMLAGTRALASGPDEADFGRLWKTPSTTLALRDIGLDSPELLSTTFLGDAEFLRAFAAGQPPLDDEHPLRLSARPQYTIEPLFVAMQDPAAARVRFEQSAWIRRLWPVAVRERTLQTFWIQEIVDRLLTGNPQRLADVKRLLRETRVQSLPLFLLESSPLEVRLAEVAAVRSHPDPMVPYVRGLGALAARDWPRAEALLAEAEKGGASVSDLGAARAFVAEMAGPPAPRPRRFPRASIRDTSSRGTQ